MSMPELSLLVDNVLDTAVHINLDVDLLVVGSRRAFAHLGLVVRVGRETGVALPPPGGHRRGKDGGREENSVADDLLHVLTADGFIWVWRAEMGSGISAASGENKSVPASLPAMIFGGTGSDYLQQE